MMRKQPLEESGRIGTTYKENAQPSQKKNTTAVPSPPRGQAAFEARAAEEMEVDEMYREGDREIASCLLYTSDAADE